MLRPYILISCFTRVKPDVLFHSSKTGQRLFKGNPILVFMLAFFCRNDKKGLVKHLRQYPNEVDQNIHDATLLFHAVTRRNFQMCSTILTCNANPDSIQHWSRLTPTYYAVMAFVLTPCKETKDICLLMLRHSRSFDRAIYTCTIDGLHHISNEVKARAKNLTTVDKLQRVSRKHVRSGQRVLRQKLLKEFGHTCPVSGTTDPDMLDAAHIVPYALCNNCFVYNACLFHKSFHRGMDLGKMRFDSLGQLWCLDGICSAELQRTYNVHHNILPSKYLSKERADMLDITFQEWKANNKTRKVIFK
jgi:hypothetical protein